MISLAVSATRQNTRTAEVPAYVEEETGLPNNEVEPSTRGTYWCACTAHLAGVSGPWDVDVLPEIVREWG